MAFAFDPARHVIVNKHQFPVTVFDADRRPLTVHSWRDVGPSGVVRDPSGRYLFAGEAARHYAQFVGPQGPLHSMPRVEAEAFLGKGGFARLAGTPVETAETVATPLGESVMSQRARMTTTPTRPQAPESLPVETEEIEPEPEPESEDDIERDDDGVELMTLADLNELAMPDLRAYASQFGVKGASKRAILDQLESQQHFARA